MKVRETLAVATAAAAVIAGGCGAPNYDEETGCGKYLEQGEATVQSLGKTLLRCWEDLPDELKGPVGGGYALSGHIPTQEGNMFFTVRSNTPLGEGRDKYIRDTREVFLTTFPDGSEGIGSTISVADQQDEGGLYTQWIENLPPKPYAKIIAGEDPPFVIAPTELADPTDPELVKCVQDDIIRQFARAIGSASGASGLPEFTMPPLATPCDTA